MELDKVHEGIVVVTIDGDEAIEFNLHSFYEILEAFVEQEF